MPLSNVSSAAEARAGRIPAGLIGGLVALLLAVLLVAAVVGPYPIPPGEVMAMLARRLLGLGSEGTAERVLFSIRLPRILAAGLVGAALAGAGAAYQALFRNPLVSPDILGVSSGAGFGAVLGILLGLPVPAIQGMGFAGGLAAVAGVVAMAAMLRGQNQMLVLVLSGIVVGTLAGAGISLVKIMADPYDQLPAITFWLLGSLAGVTGSDAVAVLPAVALGVLPLVLLRWRIGVLSLGDDEAQALGIDAPRLRMLVIAAATLVTAAAVAVAGVIGWIGLMVPHMARFLAGPRFDRLLPASLLLGAAFLVAVDTLARSMAAVEVPLGILTAAIGAPAFLVLLARRARIWAE
jgi:iron complex transport system permease protein